MTHIFSSILLPCCLLLLLNVVDNVHAGFIPAVEGQTKSSKTRKTAVTTSLIRQNYRQRQEQEQQQQHNDFHHHHHRPVLLLLKNWKKSQTLLQSTTGSVGDTNSDDITSVDESIANDDAMKIVNLLVDSMPYTDDNDFQSNNDMSEQQQHRKLSNQRQGGLRVRLKDKRLKDKQRRQQRRQQQKGDRNKRRRYNPLWPDGVSKENIDTLVEDILEDPSINIKLIPDVIESQIYKSTIILTLNLIYRLIGWIHGKRLLGHEFVISRTKLPVYSERMERVRQRAKIQMKDNLDEELLEDVARQLLSNRAINQVLIPEPLERAIYVSCLKIVFRILNLLVSSFRITLCGHDITLTLDKAINRTRLLKVARQAAAVSATSATVDKELRETVKLSPSITTIDRQILRDLARSTAAEKVYNTNNEKNVNDKGDTRRKSTTDTSQSTDKETNDIESTFWQSSSSSSDADDDEDDENPTLYMRIKEEFLVQLYTVLYALIVGILDDMLANTELVLMSNRIRFDIIPQQQQQQIDDDNDGSILQEDDNEMKEKNKGRWKRFVFSPLRQMKKVPKRIITRLEKNEESTANYDDDDDDDNDNVSSKLFTFVAGIILGLAVRTIL